MEWYYSSSPKNWSHLPVYPLKFTMTNVINFHMDSFIKVYWKFCLHFVIVKKNRVGKKKNNDKEKYTEIL